LMSTTLNQMSNEYTKDYNEFRVQTLLELQSLQKQWRKQDFKYTPEQQQRYDYLLSFRRAQVTKFYEDGLAWIGPSKAGQPLDESAGE
jgi:hypothetical protein